MIQRNRFSFPTININVFENKLREYALTQEYAVHLNSNAKQNSCTFSKIYAFGSRNASECRSANDLNLAASLVSVPDWKFIAIAYDFKNLFHNNHSSIPASIAFPKLIVFVPEFIFIVEDEIVLETFLDFAAAEELVYRIANVQETEQYKNLVASEVTPLLSKPDYLARTTRILAHIQAGDFYEINFCFPFQTKIDSPDISALYSALNAKSEAPFSGFFKWHEKVVVSSSPERFLRKQGSKLSSQPIKGTARRSSEPEIDEKLKSALKSNAKERAENVMIVDLVRNDLSKVATKNSVRVEELCEIYSFKQVHQMISTISCDLRAETSFFDILEATFPMGSMTGAPKVEAMKWIDVYEPSARGMYSGSFGYIAPNGDFDLNVIIRSILCDTKSGETTFSVGSAITASADPAEEYQECLLKAKAMMEVLNPISVEQVR
ncbi:anthranilate synthase component I family protein [Flavobacterium aurantiibacter]|uniref:Chorismate-utilising enzyme C-terminal domain-containing protein n=1 Tax=Flavobacterium aurantiibacter TaxID=2023067 RepID=A0A255ZGT2_9FLAO|nr:anthranilate synthase component I family protein [Flavobacterium aurantiibacter]OYQ40639.1 hypothetical protein CHX27_13230 [Flavobacterium aurantiibacter]